MTLTRNDNITDLSSTHQDEPATDMESLFYLYRQLEHIAEGKPSNVAVRLSGTVWGFTIVKHNPMGEAPGA